MKRVGLVGWRGMVGSVLMQRMEAEGDFGSIEPVFFTTSQVGAPGPKVGGKATGPLKDAKAISDLMATDVIITCQGGEYSNDIFPRLRGEGWDGIWIDAASALRMKDDVVIILDPVNMHVIEESLANGGRNFVGGNCTVSLMLMGMAGLFQRDEIEWMTAMTYQAASGQGAAAMRDLVAQMAVIGGGARALLDDPAAAILDIDRKVSDSTSASRTPAA